MTTATLPSLPQSLAEASEPRAPVFGQASGSPPFWPCPNNCMRWCRDDIRIVNGKYLGATNHHPRCEYVDASLIDVWRVSIPGEDQGCIVDNEAQARAMANEDPHAPLEVVALRMHGELFNQLTEFPGF